MTFDPYEDERAAARDARTHDHGIGDDRPSRTELAEDAREAAEFTDALRARHTVRIDGWNYWRGGR